MIEITWKSFLVIFILTVFGRKHWDIALVKLSYAIVLLFLLHEIFDIFILIYEDICIKLETSTCKPVIKQSGTEGFWKQCGKRRKCWEPVFYHIRGLRLTCKLKNVPCYEFEVVSTLSQTTNFTLFQIERVCRRQFQVWWKWRKVLLKGRKHCGKRRNCLWRAISPFPTLFPKDLYCRHVNIWACLGKLLWSFWKWLKIKSQLIPGGQVTFEIFLKHLLKSSYS